MARRVHIRVGTRRLRSELAELLALAEAGEVIEITDRRHRTRGYIVRSLDNKDGS